MTFIICTQKRSRPKVSSSVCEKCQRVKKCSDYQDFLNPPLFPNIPTDVIRTWEVRRKKSRKAKPDEINDSQEQLTLNCISNEELKND